MNLLDNAINLAIAEEISRSITENLKNKISVDINDKVNIERKSGSTRIKVLKNVFLPINLIDINGAGHLKELLIRSKENEFILNVFVDEEILYNNDWEWFKEISEFTSGISAFEDDDFYVLSVSDIKFSNSLFIRIDGSVQIEDIFYRIDIAKSTFL